MKSILLGVAVLCSFYLYCQIPHSISNDDFNEDIFPVIMNYIDSTHLSYLHNKHDCYLVNPIVELNNQNCRYSFWNAVYHTKYVLKKKSGLFYMKDESFEIDWDSFGNLFNQSSLDYSSIDSTALCLKFVEKKDPKKIRWPATIFPENTISFSPLIPKKTENVFEVWSSICTVREEVSIIFILVKENGEFRVNNHIWSDHCMTSTIDEIGDQLIILKK